MPRLIDIIDPSKFQNFLEALDNEPATPEHEALLVQANADLRAVIVLLPCSNNSNAESCECIVGTLLLLDLYLRNMDKETN